MELLRGLIETGSQASPALIAPSTGEETSFYRANSDFSDGTAEIFGGSLEIDDSCELTGFVGTHSPYSHH